MKSSKSKQGRPVPAKQYQPMDLCKANPLQAQEQLKPQGNDPVRMQKKMAGQP